MDVGHKPTYQKQVIGDRHSIIGPFRNETLSVTEKVAVEFLLGQVSKIKTFQRVTVDDQVVHCKNYKRITKRNNYTTKYCKRQEIIQFPLFGQVKTFATAFLTCPNPNWCCDTCICKISHHVAIINPLEVNAEVCIENDPFTEAKLTHLIPISRKAEFLAIKIVQIEKLCLFIDCDTNGVAFVGLFPNQYEKD